MIQRLLDESRTKDCRGLVVEGLAARAGPFVLSETRFAGARCRLHDNGRHPCQDYEIDVLFHDGSPSRFVECVECKVRVSTWLTWQGVIRSDVHRKMEFFACLRRVLSADVRVEVVIVTFESDTERANVRLQEHGYDWVHIIDRSAFLAALG